MGGMKRGTHTPREVQGEDAQRGALDGYSAVAGLVTLSGGVVILAGWALNVPVLTTWTFGTISTMPNTALATVVIGLALLLLTSGMPVLTRALALLGALIGGATLFEHVAGLDLGIDRLLLWREWGQDSTVAPGRIGPPASLSFLVLGCSLFLATMASRARRLALAGGVVVCVISGVSLVGYAYGASNLYSLPSTPAIAVPPPGLPLGAAAVL